MNISTLIVGSIIIGLAVDDTIHFMSKFNRYFEESEDAAESIRLTLSTTGTAMLVTSIVLAMSFYTNLLSHFYGMVHVGLLAGTAVLLAFAADVLVAPALMMLAFGNLKRTPSS